MSTSTPNLNLFKYNESDYEINFDIYTALNENWDKLDTAVANKVSKTGNETIAGVKTFSNEMYVKPNVGVIATASSGDVYPFSARRTDQGQEIKFGIGSGGVNRGIWDVKLNKWAFHIDNSKAYALGNEIPTSANCAPFRFSRHQVSNSTYVSKYMKFCNCSMGSSNTDISKLFWVEYHGASMVKGWAFCQLTVRRSAASLAGVSFQILEKYNPTNATAVNNFFKSLTVAYSFTANAAMPLEIWGKAQGSNYVTYYLRPTDMNEYGDYGITPVTISNNPWTYYNVANGGVDAITSGYTTKVIEDKSFVTVGDLCG